MFSWLVLLLLMDDGEGLAGTGVAQAPRETGAAAGSAGRGFSRHRFAARRR